MLALCSHRTRSTSSRRLGCPVTRYAYHAALLHMYVSKCRHLQIRNACLTVNKKRYRGDISGLLDALFAKLAHTSVVKQIVTRNKRTDNSYTQKNVNICNGSPHHARTTAAEVQQLRQRRRRLSCEPRYQWLAQQRTASTAAAAAAATERACKCIYFWQ
jgi:hypothetical protein